MKRRAAEIDVEMTEKNKRTKGVGSHESRKKGVTKGNGDRPNRKQVGVCVWVKNTSLGIGSWGKGGKAFERENEKPLGGWGRKTKTRGGPNRRGVGGEGTGGT